MAIRRGDPYIWVTWLTKLLSEESQCEWSAWFRAHHKDYDRLPTDLDVAAWTLEHGQLVRTRREQLLAEGYEAAGSTLHSWCFTRSGHRDGESVTRACPAL
jgi:hypothetical protein